ncbi:MAG: hypothetical protein V1679_01930, partial [Candidatus Peregrinibacteria bacterium]
YGEMVPVAGKVLKGTINVANKVLNAPVDIIEGVRARIGRLGDKIFGFIREKTGVGGGAMVPAEAHAH